MASLRALRGLYPIVDVDALDSAGLDYLEFAEALLAERPPIVQLRAKHWSARDTLALLRQLEPLVHRAGALLFANDRPDLACMAGCDGVHLGQEDLPVDEVRACFPKLLLGVSTHEISELERALAFEPDYVAFGPVFPTGSKKNAEPVVGLARLAEARRLLGDRCPLVAIGGVDRDNVAGVARHADLVSVIGALIDAKAGLAATPGRARELLAAFGEKPRAS